MAIVTDIQRAFTVLSEKRRLYDVLWQYYDGDHPLHYSTKKLQEIFDEIDARFTKNWTAVVVDSSDQRLELQNIFVEGDKSLTTTVEEIVSDNDLAVQADSVHLDMLVTGEGYLMTWPTGMNEDGTTAGCEIVYNDSRLVHLFYDPENPLKPWYGAKWWEDARTGKSRMTLYYPDRLEYYESTKPASELTNPDSWKQYQPLPLYTVIGTEDEATHIAPNPLGMVPIIQFRRELRTIKGEISQGIIDLQDAINKLINDMMVASEYSAFKQRYIISNAEDLGLLKNGPNVVWDVPGGDGLEQGTQVGEFTATELRNFVEAMADLAASMGKIAGLPISYFDLGARADPSGEALLAMEAPVNKKVNKLIKRLRGPWKRLIQMALKMRGAAAIPKMGQIKINYADPRTVQPVTAANARQANTTAGLPLRTQLRYEGWTSEEITQMEADKAEEVKAQTETLAQAVMTQQRQFDVSGGDPNG